MIAEEGEAEQEELEEEYEARASAQDDEDAKSRQSHHKSDFESDKAREDQGDRLAEKKL